jgi:hypothetical protein
MLSVVHVHKYYDSLGANHKKNGKHVNNTSQREADKKNSVYVIWRKEFLKFYYTISQ